MNVAFQQAMLKVGMENEELMKQFQLTVSLPTPDPKKPSLTAVATARKEGGSASAWNHLGLSHTVSWPLHILFTPATLEK